MSSPILSSLIFLCIFGGAVFGMFLRAALPKQHLSVESKDIVKLGTGLIGTMAALVLSLLVASAKSTYDTDKREVSELVANITLLDRILAHYGPQAEDARKDVRQTMARLADRLWAEEGLPAAQSAPVTKDGETLYEKVQHISPSSNEQRAILSQAQGVCIDILKTRLLLSAQHGSSISKPLLIVMVCWLTIIFVSFGMFAPGNSTVIVTLFICALSVSSAIFLMLELDHPFSGLIRISDAPMRAALAHFGQ